MLSVEQGQMNGNPVSDNLIILHLFIFRNNKLSSHLDDMASSVYCPQLTPPTLPYNFKVSAKTKNGVDAGVIFVSLTSNKNNKDPRWETWSTCELNRIFLEIKDLFLHIVFSPVNNCVVSIRVFHVQQQILISAKAENIKQKVKAKI